MNIFIFIFIFILNHRKDDLLSATLPTLPIISFDHTVLPLFTSKKPVTRSPD